MHTSSRKPSLLSSSILGPLLPGAWGRGRRRSDRPASTATTNGRHQHSSELVLTWDATNLYVGITKPTSAKARDLHGTDPQSDPSVATIATGFHSSPTTTLTSLRYPPRQVRDLLQGRLREYRNSDGSGGWTGAIANYGSTPAAPACTRIAIPWSAINQNGGLPGIRLLAI